MPHVRWIYKYNFNFFVLRFDGNVFSDADIQSKYGHTWAHFAKYQEKPFIVGGYDNDLTYHVKTETLLNGGTVDQTWNQLNDYPFGEM